jgi:DNA processing protein
MTETEACVALNLIPNLGPVRVRKLLQAFGSPQAALQAKRREIERIEGFGLDLSVAVSEWERQVDLPGELAQIQEFGAQVVTQSSTEYPRQLLELHNPPSVLYVWGTLKQQDWQAISVVGSRKTSHYGLECAKKLSYQLAYAGLTVVSGLARGIDTAAHQGALAANGRTIAVIGSGLLQLYPPENAGLAERIAQSGAVISEYPMSFPPSTQTFPYRNRIVAGWGRGLLVVEAGLKSGALITAEQAVEAGRLVYAVPGQIDRPTSFGSNRLIQQGAKLVTSAADILDDLSSLFPERRLPDTSTAPLPAGITQEEAAILAVMDGEMTPETLADKSNLPLPKVSANLLTLEIKRLVRQLPGRLFVKLATMDTPSPAPAI